MRWWANDFFYGQRKGRAEQTKKTKKRPIQTTHYMNAYNYMNK